MALLLDLVRICTSVLEPTDQIKQITLGRLVCVYDPKMFQVLNKELVSLKVRVCFPRMAAC